MGERYDDVVVTTGDGAFPIVAVPEGKKDPAGFAVLRTASGAVPPADARPAELGGQLLTYGNLAPTDDATLPTRTPDRQHDIVLSMADGGRRWLINRKSFGDHDPLPIENGERVRLVMGNQSMMFHPMHVHGHTFAIADRAGGRQPGTVGGPLPQHLPRRARPDDRSLLRLMTCPGAWTK